MRDGTLGTRRPGLWVCDICKFQRNADTARKCEICGARAPRTTMGKRINGRLVLVTVHAAGADGVETLRAFEPVDGGIHNMALLEHGAPDHPGGAEEGARLEARVDHTLATGLKLAHGGSADGGDDAAAPGAPDAASGDDDGPDSGGGERDDRRRSKAGGRDSRSSRGSTDDGLEEPDEFDTSWGDRDGEGGGGLDGESDDARHHASRVAHEVC